MDLLLSNETTKLIDAFIAEPSHALIISAPLGAGKPTLAKYILRDVTGNQKFDSSAYFLHIVPENNSISIDAIRKIHNFLSLKTTGQGKIRRAILIEDADTMTIEAQNSLLKSLEEPPIDTIIVLTVSHPNKLLETVFSRARLLPLAPINKSSAEAYFKAKGANEVEITKAFYISGGGPGLMTALLDDNVEHALKASIDKAKKLVSMPVFERLSEVEMLAKNKEGLPTLLYALTRVYHALLEQYASKNRLNDVKVAHKALILISKTENSLYKSASPKLLLTDLFLSL